jgi:hypothetical protein
MNSLGLENCTHTFCSSARRQQWSQGGMRNTSKGQGPWGWVSSKKSHNKIFWMLHWWMLFHSGPLNTIKFLHLINYKVWNSLHCDGTTKKPRRTKIVGKLHPYNGWKRNAAPTVTEAKRSLRSARRCGVVLLPFPSLSFLRGRGA